MKRNEIKEEYKWNLNSMFENQQAFDHEVEKAEELIQSMVAMKGHICDTIDTYITFMEQDEQLSRYVSNVYVYAKMATDVDPQNNQMQANLATASTLMNQMSVALSFASLELIKKKDVIEQYLNDPRCKDFRYPMHEIFRRSKHRLSDEQEEQMAQMQEILSNPQDTYQAFRLEFPDVNVDGKPEFLNGATFPVFLKHKNKDVRKEAFEHYLGEYKRYENAFASMLCGHAKAQHFVCKTRKYPSCLEASLFDDEATPSLYYKVLEMANEKHHAYFHEYNALKKEVLHLEEMHTYDTSLELVDEVNAHYTIEESFAILYKALAPLGEDYINDLKQAKEKRWIDFLPHVGKRAGAYSWGTYDSQPFILTNFNQDYNSLSTLAHELGHSMHSFYSKQNNRAMLSDYKIFVAEVASTVNEVLLNEYLLKTSDDPKYKAYILSNLLEQLAGTLYRQPMYAKFESQLYDWVESATPISPNMLSDYFLKLSKQYFGDAVIVDDLEGFKCYYIPHFYYNFYVYKYTIGMAVSLSFVTQILKGNAQPYRTFLTRGGSMPPIEELIEAGVDPNSDQVYDDAFQFFKKTLEELRSLLG